MSATERAARRASFIRLTDTALDRLRDVEAPGALSTDIARVWIANLTPLERAFLFAVATQAVGRDVLAEMHTIIGRMYDGK